MNATRPTVKPIIKALFVLLLESLLPFKSTEEILEDVME